jgi:hypothetical protein
MTPDASKLIAADDEARLLSLVLTESSASVANTASRQMTVAVAVNFIAGLIATKFDTAIALAIFLYGPLLVVHLLWLRRVLSLATAKKAVGKLPLWERHRVNLLLQRVDAILSAKETK